MNKIFIELGIWNIYIFGIVIFALLLVRWMKNKKPLRGVTRQEDEPSQGITQEEHQEDGENEYK